MNKVAVYGSLREGHGNWKWALRDTKSKMLSREKLTGHGMVSLGGFPAIYTDPDNENGVVVEVYEVTDDTLHQLNRLEGYHGNGESNFYDRKVVSTSVGDAFVYHIDSYKDSARTHVEHGDWTQYLEERESKMFI